MKYQIKHLDWNGTSAAFIKKECYESIFENFPNTDWSWNNRKYKNNKQNLSLVRKIFYCIKNGKHRDAKFLSEAKIINE